MAVFTSCIGTVVLVIVGLVALSFGLRWWGRRSIYSRLGLIQLGTPYCQAFQVVADFMRQQTEQIVLPDDLIMSLGEGVRALSREQAMAISFGRVSAEQAMQMVVETPAFDMAREMDQFLGGGGL